MKPLTLNASDCERVGKEFQFRCECGTLLHSELDLACPECGLDIIWPETVGYKRLLRRRRALQADAEAKKRNSLLGENSRYVLQLAMDTTEIDRKTIFIATWKKDSDKTRISEAQIIDGNDPAVVKAKVDELHRAGERGRGLISHLCHWLVSQGGAPEAKKSNTRESGLSTWMS